MCGTCGCGQSDVPTQLKRVQAHPKTAWPAGPLQLEVEKPEAPVAPPAPASLTGRPDPRVLAVEAAILSKNNRLAKANRDRFDRHRLLALNLVSSPGSGKTTLLEATLRRLQPATACHVVEGDQQTTRDAERIAATGAGVVQVNTGKGCHLEADMVADAVDLLDLDRPGVLFIENVGNLVCPALFDLGEHHRVVVASVTEGEDKPLKYPDMFRSAHLCVINKTDLLPYLSFDLEQFRDYARRVHPGIRFLEVSAATGSGLDEWCGWVLAQWSEKFED